MASPFDPSRQEFSFFPEQPARPEDGCRVTSLVSDHQALIIVGGEIDLHTVQRLRDALHEATAVCAHVLVDLDNVTFIGAAGLDALVGANAGCQSSGCRLRVVTTNPFSLRLMSLTGLGHLTMSA
jgi:anti-anti-sigma factor